jgi:hypothetical protein
VNGTAQLRYQWFFGNDRLAGSTNSVLWLTNVQPTEAGYYSVVVTNAYGSATSAV